MDLIYSHFNYSIMICKQTTKIVLEAIQELTDSENFNFDLSKKEAIKLVKWNCQGFLDTSKWEVQDLPIPHANFLEMGLAWFHNDLCHYQYEMKANNKGSKWEVSFAGEALEDIFGKPSVFLCTRSNIYFKFQGFHLVTYFRVKTDD